MVSQQESLEYSNFGLENSSKIWASLEKIPKKNATFARRK